MAKTEVILTKHIEGLGSESDQVKVAAGYARNYLIPEGLAVPVTHANKRRLEVLRQRRAEREVDELTNANELAKSLSRMVVHLKVRTSDDGKLFGSVTNGMIADYLKEQFEIQLDKRKIHLADSVRQIGEYKADLKLHAEVSASLKVMVESSTGVTLPSENEETKEAAAKG